MSRKKTLAYVKAGRVSPERAAKLLDAQAALKRRGVEPTRRGVLAGVKAGACSEAMADRWFAAERAVRREWKRSFLADSHCESDCMVAECT